MSEARFSIKEALNYGWKAFTSHVGFFIGLLVVIGLVTILPDMVVERFKGTGLLYGLGKLIVRLIGLVMGMVATKISLDIYDHGEADTSRLGELAGVFFPYLGGKILYGLIVFIGILLLIVPGLIAAYMFLYVGFLIIDRALGPIEALKESRRVTDGSKWALFVFSLVTALVNIAGALCLLVGLFVTIPVTLMASAYVYRQLSPAVRAS